MSVELFFTLSPIVHTVGHMLTLVKFQLQNNFRFKDGCETKEKLFVHVQLLVELTILIALDKGKVFSCNQHYAIR